KGLKDKEESVQLTAIEALRFFEHEKALDALHSTAKRDKKMRKEPELFKALIKAIGQHANPDSIEILGDNLWSPADHGVIQARILGLGNIRAKESVEELISMMHKAGWRKVQPFMEDFRVALVNLTGEDQGKSQPKWTEWWNDVKKTLEVSEEASSMPKAMQRKWERYWDIEVEAKEGEEPEEKDDEKKRKRRKRGDD
ncbi:MAG: HEAT repeat domain-containing protein, partial [Planctomycetota bacterium]|nr:HEAT repeat domain-containing protein [Planctomycetota bacterium]